MMDIKTTATHLVNFIKMEQRHKQDWLDHKKAKFDSKISLMKKHKDEWFALKTKCIEQLAKGAKPETYLADELNEMIKIHERQKTELKTLCDSTHKKGSDIAQAHKTELDNFKKSIA